MAAGSQARWIAFLRDRGICASCGLDAQGLEDYGEALRAVAKAEGADADALEAWWEFCRGVAAAEFDACKSFWQADHIREQCEGGGDEPENIQTLCLPCHRHKSRIRRRARIEGRANSDAAPPASRFDQDEQVALDRALGGLFA